MDHTYMTAPIFGDDEMSAVFSNDAMTRNMLLFEAALAQSQVVTTLVPKDAADVIAAVARQCTIPAAHLEGGVMSAGVPVPALVGALRDAVGTPHADYVHYGATSQDVLDTAYVLAFRQALQQLEHRLSHLLDGLEAESRRHAETPMLGRTRSQLATPITFGLRVAQWAQPLISLDAELPSIRSRALRIQFGGASGNQSAVAPHGATIARGLARELDLENSPPWHTDRSGLHTLAGWLTRLVAGLGKIGRDLGLAARNEIAEARAGGGGGSSTMPHKSNPVTSEALQALTVAAQTYAAGVVASAVHDEERDGVAWALEWLFLPQLFGAAGAALHHASTLIETLKPDRAAMAARIEDVPAVMAERAVFSLAPSLGRAKANALVKSALAADRPFREALSRAAPEIDWVAALDLRTEIAASRQVAAEIFALRRRG